MMLKALVVCALVAAATASPITTSVSKSRLFEAFKANYNKQYASAEEEASRFQIFSENIDFINQHNSEAANGFHSHTVGVNQFADLTNAEYRELYLSPYPAELLGRERNYVWLEAPEAGSVDWRQKGAVTPIKNQGQCGSCWSFSTTGSVEGAHAIATGNLVSLSEQQLMDCSTSYGNMGCNGGLMDNAFKYIIANGGIDTEQDYPYTAQDGTCDKTKESKHVVSISSYNDVPQNNEQQLAAAVAKGPVSVAIEADQQSFQMYSSGVFSGPCGTNLDHGVLVVGYTDDYWIVKNSWGASWGDQGYIMMKRGVSSSGICGIAMQPSYPVASSGPSPPSPPSPSPPSPSPPSPPSPGGNYDYEDPNNGGCHSDEQAIQVEGLPGSFCSPSCSVTQPCPTNVPPGTTAQPECVLEAQGSSSPTNCALICNPGQGGCPQGAQCQAIQGTGICTYAN